MTDQRDDRQLAASVRQEFGDASELRASLKAFGWHREFPAIKDECGFVLIGNRRLKIAEEEGIEPVIKTITFGDGKAADAERLKLALISNLGAAPFSPKDRKRIAKYLYGERSWTMARIGAALNVTQQQISKDVSGLQLSCKPPRPKGGRPKSRSKPERRVPPEKTQIIASLVLDEGKTFEQARAETGVSNTVVRRAVAQEEGRRLGRTEAEIDPTLLTLSAQQKLESVIRQHKRKLDLEFEERVREELKRMLEDTVLPHYNKKMDEYDEVIKSRKGVLTSDEYRLILSCLHPDRVSGAELKERFMRAFHAFKSHELALRSEKEMATTAPPIPRTYAEMMKAREEVKARRKHQRQQSNGMQRQ